MEKRLKINYCKIINHYYSKPKTNESTYLVLLYFLLIEKKFCVCGFPQTNDSYCISVSMTN